MKWIKNVAAFSPDNPMICECEELSWDELPKTKRKDGDYIYVVMKDNEMYDRYQKDDIVIVKLQNHCPEDGDALIHMSDDTVCLKSIKIEGDQITLTNINEFNPDPQTVKKDDIKIIGVPVSVMRAG